MSVSWPRGTGGNFCRHLLYEHCRAKNADQGVNWAQSFLLLCFSALPFLWFMCLAQWKVDDGKGFSDWLVERFNKIGRVEISWWEGQTTFVKGILCNLQKISIFEFLILLIKEYFFWHFSQRNTSFSSQTETEKRDENHFEKKQIIGNFLQQWVDEAGN